MHKQLLKSDLLFLLSAVIWGFAFVAQRMGMDHVGPFTFNGIRFLLGAMVLVPFIYNHHKNQLKKAYRHPPDQEQKPYFLRRTDHLRRRLPATGGARLHHRR